MTKKEVEVLNIFTLEIKSPFIQLWKKTTFMCGWKKKKAKSIEKAQF